MATPIEIRKDTLPVHRAVEIAAGKLMAPGKAVTYPITKTKQWYDESKVKQGDVFTDKDGTKIKVTKVKNGIVSYSYSGTSKDYTTNIGNFLNRYRKVDNIFDEKSQQKNKN